MKACCFYEKNDLRVMEIEKPVPKEDEVLIKVMACGVCGTDVHIFCGDEGCFPTPAGTVLGHEFAGIVEEVGAKVKGLKAGDRVCVDPNQLCGKCYYCLSGIGHFCEEMRGIGTGVNGGFAQYCVVPESQAYKFSEKTDFKAAAMTEPVACCLHGMDLCEISCGDTVAVIGGAGKSCIDEVLEVGADTFVTGELSHAVRAEARSLGLNLIEAGHFHTEDPVCDFFISLVKKYAPEVTCEHISSCNTTVV